MQSEARQAERLVERGEQKLREYAHPDPYIGMSLVIFLVCIADFSYCIESVCPAFCSPVLPWRLALRTQPACAQRGARVKHKMCPSSQQQIIEAISHPHSCISSWTSARRCTSRHQERHLQSCIWL